MSSNDIPFTGYLTGFAKYRFLLKELIVRDIKVKYRRSFLGIIWSMLGPLLMMLVITAVFQNIFKIAVENFPIYYLVGSTLYNFMVEATTSTLSSVSGAGSLIKKVYIPKYIFPMEKVLFALVNCLFAMVAVFIMMILLKFEIKPTVLLFPIPLLFTLVFSTGLGLILSAANVFFKDISHLYSILTSIWMYLTPIIYPIDILPESVRNVIKFNPLYYYVEYFRDVLMYGRVPGIEANLICIAFSFGFLIIGLIYFKKMQDKFVLYI